MTAGQLDPAVAWVTRLGSCVVFAVREHLPQIGGIGGGLVGWQVGTGDALSFGEATLQSHHEREVLPHSLIDRRMCRCTAQGGFGLRQVPRQSVGKPEVRQDRGLFGHDFQCRQVVTLRIGVAAHLVEHRALRGEDAPIGLVGRVGAVEHVQCLLVVSGFGKRAPISAEYGLVVRAFDGGPLEDGDRLSTLSGRAERLRIVQRNVDIRRVGAILLPIHFHVAPRIGVRVPDAAIGTDPVVSAVCVVDIRPSPPRRRREKRRSRTNVESGIGSDTSRSLPLCASWRGRATAAGQVSNRTLTLMRG